MSEVPMPTISVSGKPGPLRHAARLTLAMLACASISLSAHAGDQAIQRYPDVLHAKITAKTAVSFDFDVTISSPYDTPQRYADAFRVLGKGQQVYGERILVHDHQTEQPFTRDLYNVTIPAGVKTVQIQGRDQQYGYGGKSIEVALPGR
jgi:hypothetical protein